MKKTELRHMAISDIIIGDRYRKDYGGNEFTLLKENIKQYGILQPLAIIYDPSVGENGTYELGAGGRRLKAAIELGMTTVPCQIFPKVGNFTVRAIELFENVHRKDLTWMEEVALTKELHLLQQSIHGISVNKRSDDDGWKQQDTADMLGRSKGSISQDIELATIVEEMPELLHKCATKTEALKAISNIKKGILNDIIAEKAKAAIISTGDDTKMRLIQSYHIGDVLDGIASVPSCSIDCIEMDPPYNVVLTQSLPNVTEEEQKNLMSPEFVSRDEYNEFIRKVLSECYRVLKPDSWILLWAPIQFTEEGSALFSFYHILTSIGFKVNTTPAAWVKVSYNGSTPCPDSVLAHSIEYFLYACKGTAKIKKPGRTNSYLYQPLCGQLKVHPTERPIEMIQDVLETFALPGSTILVPFLGSGNTILSANNLIMKAFGWDISNKYVASFIDKVHNNKTFSVKGS